MKAITLYQPWASLIADRRKRYETRSWKPSLKLIGERIAIHAAAKWSEELALRAVGFGVVQPPLGAVVCTARLVAAHLLGDTYPAGDGKYRVDTMTATGSLNPAGDPDLARGSFEIDEYGDYSACRWAWRLLDIEPLDPPVPARGRLGFWEVTL